MKYHTCSYAAHLQSFLFQNPIRKAGACVHQGTSRKQERTPETADIAIYKFIYGRRLPGFYLSSWDVKKKADEFPLADRASAMYQVNNAALPKGCKCSWPVTIGMPGTLAKVQLQVYV